MPRPERYEGEYQGLRLEYMQQQAEDFFHCNSDPDQDILADEDKRIIEDTPPHSTNYPHPPRFTVSPDPFSPPPTTPISPVPTTPIFTSSSMPLTAQLPSFLPRFRLFLRDEIYRAFIRVSSRISYTTPPPSPS